MAGWVDAKRDTGIHDAFENKASLRTRHDLQGSENGGVCRISELFETRILDLWGAPRILKLPVTLQDPSTTQRRN